MIYNKLVRDKIPEIMKKDGKNPVVKTLSAESLKASLHDKLSEEIAEYLESEQIEELADICEVIDALATNGGHTFDDVLKIKASKREQRGGFDKRIFLISDNSEILKNRFNEFEIRRPTFLPCFTPSDPDYFKHNFDLVKWDKDCTGKPYCFSIARLKYDGGEWTLESIGLRFIEYRTNDLDGWLINWCKKKATEIEEKS